MSEQTFAVTYCPAPMCLSKVRVWDNGDEPHVGYCCLNCWRWCWENGVMNSVPLLDGVEIDEHSDQCVKRQEERDGWKISEVPNLVISGPPESRLHELRQGVHTYGAESRGQEA